MIIELSAVWESVKSGLEYFPNTLILVFGSLLFGLVFGVPVAFVRHQRVPWVSQFLACFVAFYQGIPIVTALMIYYLIFMISGQDILNYLHIDADASTISTIWVGLLALSISAVIWASEVIRGALASFDYGQVEAGLSVGLTLAQIVRRILLPQVIPVIIPPLTSCITGLIKNSAVVSVVGITEVTQGTILPASSSYAFFEGYIAAAIIYWGFSAVIERIMSLLSKKCGSFRRTL